MSEFGLEPTEETAVPEKRQVQTEMMVSRETEEVQAAMVIAKRFPRDTVLAYNRVLEACKRQKLAENAVYEYQRGGTKVTGPTIRLAEAIAQNWGNIDYGITELEQKNGESQVMAYAWDLETNTRQTRIFSVKHVRHTKNGDYPLTDPRDIYELIANNGARRERACILGVIPTDIVDGAIEQCNKTMAGNAEKPLEDLIRDMVSVFQTQFGVTKAQLENYIGWKSESFTMNDIVKLKRVYNSLKDGMARKEEIFDMKITEDVVDAFAEQSNNDNTAKAGKAKNSGRKAKEDGQQDNADPVQEELPWNQ